jgi:spore coat polysaccharide biosynthesis predicted glycosyltransferase SpsG
MCESQSINIHIVTGPGYRNYEELAAEVAGDDFVYLTHATGVISSIMEKVQLAITSNGRTVYELAHMNIPSIVISQHDRERTHAFARKENGVIPLDLYEENITERKAIEEFEKLVFDVERRLKLYDKIKAISFSENKRKVISIILGPLKS